MDVVFDPGEWRLDGRQEDKGSAGLPGRTHDRDIMLGIRSRGGGFHHGARMGEERERVVWDQHLCRNLVNEGGNSNGRVLRR